MFGLKVSRCIRTELFNTTIRQFSATYTLRNKGWRLANGYPTCWSDRGILTDGPDFTYADGRPVPYGNGQRARLLMHRNNAEKVVYLLKAVQYAKQTFQEKVRKIEDGKQAVLDRKLKPKGNLLRKKKL